MYELNVVCTIRQHKTLTEGNVCIGKIRCLKRSTRKAHVKFKYDDMWNLGYCDVRKVARLYSVNDLYELFRYHD